MVLSGPSTRLFTIALALSEQIGKSPQSHQFEAKCAQKRALMSRKKPKEAQEEEELEARALVAPLLLFSWNVRVLCWSHFAPNWLSPAGRFSL